ncbi:hypothetical protein B0H10DRAFT_1814438, partial [Mycena sp. CBHHK59/15]
GNNVHRIKADEQRGFLIVTTSRGGLFVVDLYDDQVLWSLPAVSIQAFNENLTVMRYQDQAHCEYGEGYDMVLATLDQGDDDNEDPEAKPADSEWTTGDAIGKVLAFIKQVCHHENICASGH